MRTLNDDQTCRGGHIKVLANPVLDGETFKIP